MADKAKTLTVSEAQRAIYIDFEGFKGKPPTFFGWVWAIGKKAGDDHLACIHDIHDKALWPLVGEVELPSGTVDIYQQRPFTVGQSINDLARRAKNQDRRIVSWSTYEMVKIAESELSPSLLRMFEHNYRDGKVTAKEWFEELRLTTAKQTNTLVRYLEEAEYPLPKTYGLGQTTKRLKSVLGGMENKGSWSRLLDGQQKNWEGLLVHNFADCHGLRHITKMATAVLNS